MKQQHVEDLPNEILFELFHYFDTRELFRGFYFLNQRFNYLLQSLPHLSLTLHQSNDNNNQSLNEILFPRIYTLKLNYRIHIYLNQFIHLHRLILLSPTSKQFQQLLITHLPNLEHLSIGNEHFLYSTHIHELSKKIFSSRNFPRLKSCYLYEEKFLEFLPTFTTSNDLRILKVNEINLQIYQSILSLCPQLNSLQFTINNSEHIECERIQFHYKLQRMRIKFPNFQPRSSEEMIETYLFAVPCLYQLKICEMNFDENIEIYLQSNWFASIIDRSLHQIERFDYVLFIYGLTEQMNEILQRNFHNVHAKHVQSRLMTINRFEYLPNELLIEIFEYMDIRDLFHGFLGLNQRINHLLRMISNLSFHLERDEPELIDFFVDRITRLVINAWQEIDLQPFQSVRSLVFHQMTANQYRQIQSNSLPNLLHLSTSAIPELTLMPQLLQDILSNAIPTLRSMDIGLVQIPSFSCQLQCPSLSFISIHSTQPSIIFFLLNSSPNLKTFHVYFQMNTTPIFALTPVVNNHSLKNFLFADPYHHLSYNHIHAILPYMSQLRRINLNFRCRIPFIRLAQNLINRLPELRQFHCSIDDISDDQTTSIKNIQMIHPCFQRLQCSTTELQFRTFVSF